MVGTQNIWGCGEQRKGRKLDETKAKGTEGGQNGWRAEERGLRGGWKKLNQKKEKGTGSLQKVKRDEDTNKMEVKEGNNHGEDAQNMDGREGNEERKKRRRRRRRRGKLSRKKKDMAEIRRTAGPKCVLTAVRFPSPIFHGCNLPTAPLPSSCGD